MIQGVEGQWKISIENQELDNEEITQFFIRDKTGLTLPEFEIDLKTKNHKVVRRLAKKEIKLKIGIGKDEVKEVAEFISLKTEIQEGGKGSGNYNVKIKGVLDVGGYLFKSHSKTYTSESSGVWATVMERNKLQPITENSNDKMMWIQANQTDRNFLEKVIWHGFYNKNDLVLTAIRRNKKAVYLPFSKLKRQKAIFGNSDNADYQAKNFSIVVSPGFLSAWAGSDRTLPSYQLEDGIFETDDFSSQSQILKMGLMNVNRQEDYKLMSDNVHKNYWTAYNQNKGLRASLSTTSITVNFNQYVNLFPLDYIKFNWYDIEDQLPLEMVTGHWLIVSSNVSLVKHTFEQSFLLTRESLF